MYDASPTAGGSFLDSLDPRVRLLGAVSFAVVASAAQRPSTLGAVWGAAALGTVLARMQPLQVLRRLAPVNLFALALIVILPLSTGVSSLFAWGPIRYSQEGLLLALVIALKANAIVMGTLAMLGTLSLVRMGHALEHMRVPQKLVHLLLFTIRYIDVLHGEYLRLRTAMKMRGFRPRACVETYRAFGNLVGMLLLRSLDRAERVMAAMKCRGYRGRFYRLDLPRFTGRDAWFAVLVVTLVSLMAWWEYS